MSQIAVLSTTLSHALRLCLVQLLVLAMVVVVVAVAAVILAAAVAVNVKLFGKCII